MDEFFRDVYAPIIFKWLSYQDDNKIKIKTIYNNELYQTITFNLKQFQGTMTLWHIGVIEEKIINLQTDESLFYLHYKFSSIPHFMRMSKEF